MSLPYDGAKIDFAKKLRKEATKAENHLWYDFLRHYPIRFQRQKTIDVYIVDFYCHRAKLAIELDGSQHYTEEGILYDVQRSEKIESYGVKLLRFASTNVMDHTRFGGICDKIDYEVQLRIATLGENRKPYTP